MKNEIEYIDSQQESQLYGDVCQIIDGARSRIATYVNTEACLTNWYIGKRIKEDVLYNKRAEYGKQVVVNLSVKLTERYGSGWSEKTLRHCLRAAETFSEKLHKAIAIAREHYKQEHSENDKELFGEE